jgi:hypothetical protein
MLIRILLTCLADFYAPDIIQAGRIANPSDTIQEWTDLKRLYAFFVPRTCSVYDLRTRLEEELSLPYDSTHIYFSNKYQDQTTTLLEIPQFTLSNNAYNILTVICSAPPLTPFNQIAKEPLNEIKISDIRYLNCGHKVMPWNPKHFDPSNI